MKQPHPFHALVTELFAPLGPVDVKRMFGGAGVFSQGLMFGLIADDVLYLKADHALHEALAAEGSQRFVWVPSSGPRAGEAVPMSYWSMPEAALDDPELASVWGRRAHAVALAQAAVKVSRKRKG